jgi:hypothetical protein
MGVYLTADDDGHNLALEINLGNHISKSDRGCKETIQQLLGGQMPNTLSAFGSSALFTLGAIPSFSFWARRGRTFCSSPSIATIRIRTARLRTRGVRAG